MAHIAAPPATTGRIGRTTAIVLLAIVCWLAAVQIGAREAAAALPAGACTVPAVSQYLAADATGELGVIDLVFFDAGGSRVVYSECVGRRPERLGTARSASGTITALPTPWSCVRLVRHFIATTTLPDGRRAAGSYSVRTPSCSRRFELSVPRRMKPGSSTRIRIVDRWGIGGIHPRLCITPPGAARSCRTLAFARAVAVLSRRFRAAQRGRWRVELRVRGHSVRATVAVGGEAAAMPALPKLLATGDSTMQGIDNFLADDLAASHDVRSGVRPGTGISKLNPWARIAARDVRRLHPSVTVVSIGANDAWPMTTAVGLERVCCGQPWVAEYALRARSMMRTYLRRGRGRVIWLTLPVPRDPRRVPIFAAVNRAAVLAADGLAGVTVLRMDALFSPSGRYQSTISYRGRDVDVREPDGVHLNVSGTAIAARAVVKALRAP